MKNYKSIFKVLNSEYMSCSINGNPKKRLILENDAGDVFTATTGTDCLCGYMSYYKGDKFMFTYHYTPKTGNMVITYAGDIKQ